MTKADATTGPRQTVRADKWLFFARFFKTRTLAAQVISGRHLRINGTHARKPAQAVGPGDVLTFPQGETIRVIEVVTCGARRGPATEAATLFLDRTPVTESVPRSPRFEGKGRPSKKDRRDIDLLLRGNDFGNSGPLE